MDKFVDMFNKSYTTMDKFVELFNKLYTTVELNPGECLADLRKVIFPDYYDLKKDEEISCFVNNTYDLEVYWEIEKKHNYFSVYKHSRNDKISLCENKTLEYAAVTLFIHLIPQYKIKSVDSQEAPEDRIFNELKSENLDTAKELLKENLGDLISFGENVFDKLSICALPNNKWGVFYHKKWIYWYGPTDNIGKIYNFVCGYCVSIKEFRKLLTKIVKVVPLNDPVENSKLEFLYITGDNEDTATG